VAQRGDRTGSCFDRELPRQNGLRARQTSPGRDRQGPRTKKVKAATAAG